MRCSVLVPLTLPAVFVMTLLTGAARAEEARPAQATATLPLEELLALHEAGAAVQAPDEPPAPLPALVVRVELGGRLLDRAVDLDARFDVKVLSSAAWTDLPLVAIDASTHVSAVPEIPGAILAVRDGQLRFLSRMPGTYAFEVSVLQRAEVTGEKRHVALRLAPSTMSVLRLDVDDRLFTLDGDWDQGADGAVIYPDDHTFEVSWTRRGGARSAPPVVERPPVESVIVRAHASVVSTLEGRRISRLLYELRFEGSEELRFEIPSDQEVSKVFLNGAAIPVRRDGAILTVPVYPEREGDESGRVELVLKAREPGYSLSGDLLFTFPGVSWATNELFVALHLPQVFNYTWRGGSLSGDGPVHAAPSYTESLPTPGKRLSFHQYLVEGGATLRVDYTVDLAGRFYR
jgi:hypothetical protein